MKKYIFLVVGIIIFFAGLKLLSQKGSVQTVSTPTPTITSAPDASTNFRFNNPKRSAHHETNTPKHTQALAGVPINVVIDFNFDLAEPSNISILKDGKDYGANNTTIDSNKLSMRRDMQSNAPGGVYTVEYKACWPDKTCHNGNFQFGINKAISGNFKDITGQTDITINMTDIKFKPENIKISKGTKITWVNNDSEEHFVNTDSHPAHTYYPPQNSRGLQKGDTFSIIFTRPGIYPYHCSAHEQIMKGMILVE